VEVEWPQLLLPHVASTVHPHPPQQSQDSQWLLLHRGPNLLSFIPLVQESFHLCLGDFHARPLASTLGPQLEVVACLARIYDMHWLDTRCYYYATGRNVSSRYASSSPSRLAAAEDSTWRGSLANGAGEAATSVIVCYHPRIAEAATDRLGFGALRHEWRSGSPCNNQNTCQQPLLLLTSTDRLESWFRAPHWSVDDSKARQDLQLSFVHEFVLMRSGLGLCSGLSPLAGTGESPVHCVPKAC
jgi:hypothetical protein